MRRAIVWVLGGLADVGCATAPVGPSAVAVLEPTKGNTAGGKVTFVQKGDNVVVLAQVSGLMADSYGDARLRAELAVVTVDSAAPTDVIGKSVVVHKDADDYKTQPTGNSGARVACGVVRKS